MFLMYSSVFSMSVSFFKNSAPCCNSCFVNVSLFLSRSSCLRLRSLSLSCWRYCSRALVKAVIIRVISLLPISIFSPASRINRCTWLWLYRSMVSRYSKYSLALFWMCRVVLSRLMLLMSMPPQMVMMMLSEWYTSCSGLSVDNEKLKVSSRSGAVRPYGFTIFFSSEIVTGFSFVSCERKKDLRLSMSSGMISNSCPCNNPLMSSPSGNSTLLIFHFSFSIFNSLLYCSTALFPASSASNMKMISLRCLSSRMACLCSAVRLLVP